MFRLSLSLVGFLALTFFPSQSYAQRSTEEEFHTSPKIGPIKAFDGSEYSLCVASVYRKADRQIGIGVTEIGPRNSCPGDPEDYQGDSSTISTVTAKFEGNIQERALIDGEKWMFEVNPSAVYRLIGKNGKGEDQWDSFCTVTLMQDPFTLNGARPKPSKILVYPKQKSEVINGVQHVYCDACQEAWRKRITLQKPTFIGDLKQIALTVGHASGKPPTLAQDHP